MTPLRLLPEAREATVWYEERRVGLGAEFIAALMNRVRKAEAMPGVGRLERDARRRPGYWRHRLVKLES